MLTLQAYSNLHSQLIESGYRGSLEELINHLDSAQRESALADIFREIDRKHFKPEYEDTKGRKELKDLLTKLVRKYSDFRADSSLHRSSVHFLGKKHPTTGYRFSISITLIDETNQGAFGYYGEKVARIQYGYDDHRAEKKIVLVKKEPY